MRFYSLYQYKTEVALFSFAFLIRIIAFCIFLNLSAQNQFPFPVNGNDAVGYVRIAYNLIEHGAFSRETVFPYNLDSFRTPGYPIFIASILLLFKSLLAVSIFQISLASFSVVLLYRIVTLYAKRWVGLGAALIFALEPGGIFLSSVLLSEVLFTFLLLLSLYFFLRLNGSVLKSGLALGLATLVRPIGFMLWPVFIVGIFFIYQKAKLKTIFIFSVAFLLFILPWSFRNRIEFGSWQLSDVLVRNFFTYNAPLFIAHQQNISEDAARSFLKSELQQRLGIVIHDMTLANAEEVSDIYMPYIRQHPLSFTKFYFIKALPFFFTDGITDVSAKLGITKEYGSNLSTLILNRQWQGLRRSIFAMEGVNILFLIGVIIWSGISILMVIAVADAYWAGDKFRFHLLFLFIAVICTAVLSGVVVNYRLRYPVSPIMIGLAIIGACRVANVLRGSNLKRSFPFIQ